MATFKILLLSLIALSCFQVQSVKVIPNDVTDDFNQAVDKLNVTLVQEIGIAVRIINHNKEQGLQIATMKLEEFDKAVSQIETEAKKNLENLSESCKDAALTALDSAKSNAHIKVVTCYFTYEEENEKTAKSGRDVLAGEFMGYPRRLREQFEACLDEDCRLESLEEANTAIGMVKDEVSKVLEKTLLAQLNLRSEFEGDCLTVNGRDYQDQTRVIVEDAEKCEG